jgi:nicotinamidase-related amidase
MRITVDRCAAVIVDVQERLLPHMFNHAEVLHRLSILIRGLTVLETPLLLTEQYPKGLGPTMSSIRRLLPAVKPIEKLSFSCADEPAFMDSLQNLGREVVIIGGIESHVCILQTSIDLKAAGFTPIVIADAISSRRSLDSEVAVQRMHAEGILLSTGESILFELCRKAGNDRFKAISRLVK